MKHPTALALVILAALASAAMAQNDPMQQKLFPPELLMKFSEEIGLAEEQVATVKRVIQEAQADTIDLQREIQSEARKMADLLDATPIDEESVLEQADRVMALERRMKKTQLRLLIRIKNTLSPEQQAKLQELRPRESRPPGPPR